MNRINVALHIIPKGVPTTELENYDRNRCGSVLSNDKEIKVNKVLNGYTIVYDDDTFKGLDTVVFATSFVQIFKKNLPNTVIDAAMLYHFELESGDDAFDEDTAKKVIELSGYFASISNPVFRYRVSESVVYTVNYYKDINEPDDRYDDDDPDSFFNMSGYDDDDDEDDDPFDILSRGLDGYRKKHKRHREFDSYGRSKILRNSDNAKKAYNRHGLLIIDDKDDLKKDEKIIKEFLKDFFPGDSSWKKEFRRDVLKRWISMYAISKKNLKSLERDYRRKSRNSQRRSNIDTEKAIDFTRRLFNVPLDRWSDPSK